MNEQSMGAGEAPAAAETALSERLVRGALRPFQQFVRTESAGGIVLLACTALALTLANSPWAGGYHHLWELPLTLGLPGFGITESLHHWINDGLMAVFFFLVGLEIKRELLVGELASLRQAALPIAAAVGGMVVPASLYALLNAGGPGAAGWGIPMATDIAFALGIVALLGSRVPLGAKVFLAALAIVDDIGAVLVIALFYTARISWPALALAGVVLAILLVLNRGGVRHPLVYAALGVVLWLAFLGSGVHATVAGVLLAMTIPARTRIDEREFLARVQTAVGEFRHASAADESLLTNRAQIEAIRALEGACERAQAPLTRIEDMLHAPVALLVMPLFALANAGVDLRAGGLDGITSPVALGVVLGLTIGKPVGITLFARLAVRLGIAVRPADASWRTLHGVSWLAGIGFTMSLFVANLAFGAGPLLGPAKLGILAASVVAGAVGWLLLTRSARA